MSYNKYENLPKLNELKYKFIISNYDEYTDLETRHLCVDIGNGQNAVLYTYQESRNTNKSILLAGIYTIMNPYTLWLLPVGWKGYENIVISNDMEFNFIREKESYLLNAFISQTTTKINKGE